MNDANALIITFLGTSSGTPTRRRNVSSVVLELPQRREVWLFDCGEATQHQFLHNAELQLSKIRKIFITHMHGDHIYGLPGLLASLGKHIPDQAIDLYGPPDLQAYLQQTYRYSQAHMHMQLRFHPVATGMILDETHYQVFASRLAHRIPAYGFRIVEKERPGKLDIEKIRATGLPEGPLYQRLKMGESITLADGRVLESSDFVGAKIPGRIIVYCTDTTYCDSAIALAKEATVLIHESTYLNSEKELAQQYQHATASMAAQVALQAKVQTLILTHFSPRYEKQEQDAGTSMLAEAKAIFPNAIAAYDHFRFVVPAVNL